ncbi:50S ribosomal protein L11 methyltransferase [Zhouia amylolytica]|uniref:50S ribosomal protein L11 methyltransferase n=1 Tax=Zhouia amylolytica TaxID=376730 RepID=UPI0020CCD322|nr:50S ribosomal protein L11 methyltransferase [Zhouia amylolytica]MCQ0110534.1 50S ribosomal protein L11 methyltransferase [Zhouia amylolytica]
MVTYIGYDFKVSPINPGNEILIAELGSIGFESFVETEDGLLAYINKDEWFENILDEVYILNNDEFSISYSFKDIEQVNWNEEWEKNFEAIEVDGVCTVRAPFHDTPKTEFDIVIEPKMSFGTGHHETTHMMIQHLLKMDLEGKKTLDMGCGTAVLAILAEKMGAQHIDAIDIDNWCYLNSLENAERNNCKHITVYEGDASLLEGRAYDLIIANINRNILLRDIPVYVKSLRKEGVLLLSGFYKEDLDQVKERCAEFSLKFVENLEKNHWVAAKFLF